MFPYWEQSTNSLTSCRFSRHSTVSAWRLIECLTCWRRGWDSARSLRELPANMRLCRCVGRTGFESPYLTRRENKMGPRGAHFCFLAERVGFEPTVRYNRTPDFESGTFGHSVTSPRLTMAANCTQCSSQIARGAYPHPADRPECPGSTRGAGTGE